MCMCKSGSRLFEDYATNGQLKFPSKFVENCDSDVSAKKCVTGSGELIVHRHTSYTATRASMLDRQLHDGSIISADVLAEGERERRRLLR